MLLPLFLSASTAWATNVVAFPLEIASRRCEYLISDARLKRHRYDKLLFSPFDVRAQLATDLTPTALRLFGLERVRSMGVTENLAVRMQLTNARWWLSVITRGNGTTLFVVEVSGMAVREWLHQPNSPSRPYGLRWRGREGVYYYFSVEVVARHRRYAFGFDVPCAQLRQFSGGSVVESVTDETSWSCRVPVLAFRRKL